MVNNAHPFIAVQSSLAKRVRRVSSISTEPYAISRIRYSPLTPRDRIFSLILKHREDIAALYALHALYALYALFFLYRVRAHSQR